MPITPVFEQPPVNPRGQKGIDWQPTLDALAEKPGEWARVDGPWPIDKTGVVSSRLKSLRGWAKKVDLEVEVISTAKDGQRWIYARTVTKAAEKAAPTPAPKPVAAVPDVTTPRTEFGGDHDCPTCDATFRTNIRLRQHQANAHKAS